MPRGREAVVEVPLQGVHHLAAGLVQQERLGRQDNAICPERRLFRQAIMTTATAGAHSVACMIVHNLHYHGIPLSCLQWNLA